MRQNKLKPVYQGFPRIKGRFGALLSNADKQIFCTSAEGA